MLFPPCGYWRDKIGVLSLFIWLVPFCLSVLFLFSISRPHYLKRCVYQKEEPKKLSHSTYCWIASLLLLFCVILKKNTLDVFIQRRSLCTSPVLSPLSPSRPLALSQAHTYVLVPLNSSVEETCVNALTQHDISDKTPTPLCKQLMYPPPPTPNLHKHSPCQLQHAGGEIFQALCHLFALNSTNLPFPFSSYLHYKELKVALLLLHNFMGYTIILENR